MSKTANLNTVIERLIDNRLAETHVALPAIVQTYDAAKRSASVKPSVSRRLRDGREFELPVINHVPVVMLGTSNAIISVPIQPGDGVLLVFSERSLDEWLSLGGVVTPQDARTHDISDAVAIPGLFHLGVNNGASATDLVIKHKTSSLTIKPNGDVTIDSGTAGKVDVGNSLGKLKVKVTGDISLDGGAVGRVAIGNAAAELLNLVDLLMLQLTTTTVTVGGIPYPLDTAAAFAALEAQLLLIKGTL